MDPQQTLDDRLPRLMRTELPKYSPMREAVYQPASELTSGDVLASKRVVTLSPPHVMNLAGPRSRRGEG